MRFGILILPFAVLVLFAAIVGYRMGQGAMVPQSETEAISRVAAAYVGAAPAGADLRDCSARAGARIGVWIVVTCVHPVDPEASVTRYIGHDGQDILTQDLPGQGGPET